MRRSAVLPAAFLVAVACALPAGCSDTTTLIGTYSPRQEPGTGGASEAQGGDSGQEGDTPLPTLGIYFEAEEGTLSGPFVIDSTTSGDVTFITASEPSASENSPGGARAIYPFTIEENGEYLIWGRIHSPGALENRFWFRVDDGPWKLWRISTGEEWFWDDFHDDVSFGVPIVFQWEAGLHQLELANAVLGAELDRIAILPRGAPPPEQSVICNPPHSVLLDGQCVPSCGSYVSVSCGQSVCAGRQEVVAYDCAICCLLD